MIPGGVAVRFCFRFALRATLQQNRTLPSKPQRSKGWAKTTCQTQGGVVSPILMNLFMHYAFDCWMKRTHLHCPFARYADDAVVHCRSQKQAEVVMQSIASRLEVCGLASIQKSQRLCIARTAVVQGTTHMCSLRFLVSLFDRGMLGTSRAGYLLVFSRGRVTRPRSECGKLCVNGGCIGRLRELWPNWHSNKTL